MARWALMHCKDAGSGVAPCCAKAELPRQIVPLNSGVLGGSPLCTVPQQAGRWRCPVSDMSSRWPPAAARRLELGSGNLNSNPAHACDHLAHSSRLLHWRVRHIIPQAVRAASLERSEESAAQRP